MRRDFLDSSPLTIEETEGPLAADLTLTQGMKILVATLEMQILDRS